MTSHPTSLETTPVEDDEIHVCHMLHSLALGGLQNMILGMIEASEEDAVKYTVCYFGDDASLRAEFEAAGARVIELDTVSTTPGSQFHPRSLAHVTRFLRQESFDVLHTHVSLYVLVVGRLCARLADTPVVGTYHNTRDTYHPSMRLLERVTRPLSTVNVAVSKGVERTYSNSAHMYDPEQWTDEDSFDRRTVTIYNGIDVESFASNVREATTADVDSHEESDDGFVFLTVGRYSAEKNQAALIRAMAPVIDELPNAKLYVVGWGPLESELRQTASACGVSDSVTVTGRVPSVHEYYALADAFVLPSLTEGLSVVLLEAMASGLPVIATDVAGSGEAVVDGTTGYVVSPESSTALADAMVRVATNDPEEMGQRGYERVTEQFSINHTTASYLDIYRQMC